MGSALNPLIERSSRSKLMILKYWRFIFNSLSGRHCGSSFLASYCGNNSGTDMLKQHARSVVSCIEILAHNRRNGRLFPPFPLPARLSH